MASTRHLVSEAEFLALPETMERIELLDGEVIGAPAPMYWHQELIGRIVFELRRWARARGGPVCVGQSPLDVRFGPGRILQPDAFVILASVPADLAGPLVQIPEVCIEVLSTNRAYDRITKRAVYASAGVRECWLVEPAGPVERWSGVGLAECETLTDRLISPLLPGFELDLAELFRR